MAKELATAVLPAIARKCLRFAFKSSDLPVTFISSLATSRFSQRVYYAMTANYLGEIASPIS
jgi:hypothetical protein